MYDLMCNLNRTFVMVYPTNLRMFQVANVKMAEEEVQGSFSYTSFKNEETTDSTDDGAAATPTGNGVTTAGNDVQMTGVTVEPNHAPTAHAPAEDSTATAERGCGVQVVTSEPRGAIVGMTMNGGVQRVPTAVVIEEEWGWGNLVLSVCSLCCCGICGIFATVLAILAYVDHRVKDFEASHNKRKVANGLAIAAIASGSILLLVGLVILGVSMT